MTRGPEFFYVASGVPKNRLGLVDAEALARAEQDLTYARTLELKAGAAPQAARSGAFDLAHLTAIHQHIFQDVFDWAGTTRAHPHRVEGELVQVAPLIHKDDGRPAVPFVPSPQVDRALNATFGGLREQDYLRGLPRADFAERAATVFAEINGAHAFMEGNGRTQREFMLQLAAQAGHPVNFDVVSAERMSMVSLEARMGDTGGMVRLFQEVSDPGRVAALDKAQGFLERENVQWHNLYIASAAPGRSYDGVIALSSPSVCVLRVDGDVIVARAEDLGGPTRGRVGFTAGDYPTPPGEEMTRGRSLNLGLE